MNVKNIENDKGIPVKNQFVIFDSKLSGKNWIFKSYDSIICSIFDNGQLKLNGDMMRMEITQIYI